MAKPTLVVQEQPSQLDYLIPVKLDITSDATSVVITVQDENIIEVNNEEKTIKGIKTGSTRITVTATNESDDGQETTEVSWLCEVVQILTTLTVSDINADMTIGSEQIVEITTNAENGFTVTSSDLDIIRPLNTESPVTLYAIGIGIAEVVIKARKNNSDEKVYTYRISVEEREHIVDDGVSVGIKLTNSNTARTVNITTTNNKSFEDVTFYFPSRSGTILTKEGMINGSFTMIDRPRIISPLDGEEQFSGEIISTSYTTLLSYTGTHNKTKWQLASDINFTNNLKEWEKDYGDLTKTNFTCPFGKWYIRCKYYSEDFESDWSVPISFSFSFYNPEKSSLEEPIKFLDGIENKLENSYFGHLPHSELIDDYRYRGNIMTIRKYFNVLNFYNNDAAYGSALDLISFKKGEQVTYNNKLYYSTQDQQVTRTADTNTTNNRLNRNDMVNPPGWNKLENLAKHDLMIKYLPLTIQNGKKYVIEVYTDAEEFSLTSNNTNVMIVEEGDTTGEDRDPTKPNGTDIGDGKMFTLTGVGNGTCKIIFKSVVNEEIGEMPTFFKRDITVNGTNMVPRIPTPLLIEGMKYTVDNVDDSINLTLSTGTTIVPNLVQPDIFLVEDSYLQYSSKVTNGNYMPASSVTTINVGAKLWSFSTNGVFYCQITNAANGNVGYATSTFIVVRSYGYDNYWKLDERSNLLTPRSLIDKIGIGLGKSDDGDFDGFTFGNTALGELINSECGYHKYIHNGSLCYITAQPICEQIAWNDIAVREIGYKQRTIRVGGNLYYVRLPYKEELMTLLTSLHDNKYDSLDVETDMNINTDMTIWTLDDKTGGTRTVVKWDGTNFVEDELDPKSRTGTLMLVLEYVNDNQAPYKNLESCFPGVGRAENENFEYDPITDTGFFGFIKPEDFITSQDFAMAVFSTNALRSGDWLKFYWHGQIIIVSRKIIKNSLTRKNLNDYELVYGFDTGGKGLRVININGVDYRHICILGMKSDPYDKPVFPGGAAADDGEFYPSMNLLNLGEYSMWNELVYRVTTGYAGYTEVEWDDVNPGSWYANYCRFIGGYQIGDNWSNFPTINLRNKNWQTNVTSDNSLNLNVNYDTDGSPAETLSREHSVTKLYCSVGLRDVSQLTTISLALTTSSGNIGHRPVLALAPRL